MHIPKESIFKSIIRAFFTSFFRFLGGVVSLVILAVIVMSSITSSATSSLTALRTQPKYQVTQNILPDHNGNINTTTKNSIAVIPINGVIGCEALTTEAMRSLLTTLKSLPSLKGLILHINSPGGGVNETSSIFNEILLFKERHNIPVEVFVDGICASGSMYIACVGDSIHSTKESIIGSVGVIAGPFFNYKDLFSKYDIKTKIFSRGADKQALSPFASWSEDEGSQDLPPIIDEQYKLFVDHIVKYRPIEKDTLINEYGAKIFSANTAKEYGFIDNGTATFQTILQGMVSNLDIENEDDYLVLEFTATKPPFSDLFNGAASLSSLFLPTPLSTSNEVSSYLWTPQ